MGKERQQRIHFKRRLEERYERVLTDGDIDFIIARIRKRDSGSIRFITKQTNRLSVFCITYKDFEFVAVYDGQRKQLVTALPINCKDPGNITFYSDSEP